MLQFLMGCLMAIYDYRQKKRKSGARPAEKEKKEWKNGDFKFWGMVFDKDGNPKDEKDAGYNPDGYDADGYDREGYDREGFTLWGLDREGYNRDGYDSEGYNREGRDHLGFDRNGLDSQGRTIEEVCEENRRKNQRKS